MKKHSANRFKKINYKTEICLNYSLKGECQFGKDCKFAHGKAELHKKVIKNRNYKKRDCKAYFEEGFCSFGLRCAFKHKGEDYSEALEVSYLTLIEHYSPLTRRLAVFKKVERSAKKTRESSLTSCETDAS